MVMVEVDDSLGVRSVLAPLAQRAGLSAVVLVTQVCSHIGPNNPRRQLLPPRATNGWEKGGKDGE